MIYKFLCVVAAFLLICALTTSLVGNEPPSMMEVLVRVSEVNIDFDAIISSLKLFENIQIDYIGDINDFGWQSIPNLFIQYYNTVFASIITFAWFCLNFWLQVISSVLVVVDLFVYLLFGIEIGFFKYGPISAANNAIVGLRSILPLV